MITCKECTHWGRTPGTTRGDCLSPKAVTARLDMDKDNVLVYQFMETGEDFGCINGEKDEG